MESTSPSAQVSVAGNWQVSSTAQAAKSLSVLSGSLTGTGASLTGILHARDAGACIPSTTTVLVNGSTDSHGLTTISGLLAGGTLTLTGTLAADGKSLSGATYTVTGGNCAFSASAAATAQAFAPITGTYSGMFSDASGPVLAVSATLSQTPASDADGNFTLSGTGSFGTNECFLSPVNVSNTQVTGGTFTLTYADAQTGNQVSATGTFSSDGTALTVSQWTLSGSCGADTGSGTLTRTSQ